MGLWEPWLAAYGFELRGVNYAKTGERNARLALDISLASKANAAFANAGIPNWRSLVVADCAQVQIEKPTEKEPAKAYAIFYLDAADEVSGAAGHAATLKHLILVWTAWRWVRKRPAR